MNERHKKGFPIDFEPLVRRRTTNGTGARAESNYCVSLSLNHSADTSRAPIIDKFRPPDFRHFPHRQRHVTNRFLLIFARKLIRKATKHATVLIFNTCLYVGVVLLIFVSKQNNRNWGCSIAEWIVINWEAGRWRRRDHKCHRNDRDSSIYTCRARPISPREGNPRRSLPARIPRPCRLSSLSAHCLENATAAQRKTFFMAFSLASSQKSQGEKTFSSDGKEHGTKQSSNEKLVVCNEAKARHRDFHKQIWRENSMLWMVHVRRKRRNHKQEALSVGCVSSGRCKRMHLRKRSDVTAACPRNHAKQL